MFGVTGRMYARRFPFLFGKSRDLPADAAVHKSSGGPGVQPSVSVSGSCSGCKNGGVRPGARGDAQRDRVFQGRASSWSLSSRAVCGQKE